MDIIEMVERLYFMEAVRDDERTSASERGALDEEIARMRERIGDAIADSLRAE